MTTKASFLNRQHWSENRFAFCYAAIIVLMASLYHFILKSAGIHEIFALRLANIFFFLIGFYLLVRDYIKSTGKSLNYVQAFWLCAKSGLFFCLLFLPILMFSVANSPAEMKWVGAEFLTSASPVLQIVVSTYLVTIPTIVISGITIAFAAAIWNGKTAKH